MPGGFEELEVYQEARKSRQRVFTLTAKLPEHERYVLTSQMRRAALSVTNNIAEGHGARSWRHNISYLYRSRGSVNELIDDFSACEDQGYFSKEHLDDIRGHADSVNRLINGYVAYLRRRIETEGNRRRRGEDDRTS